MGELGPHVEDDATGEFFLLGLHIVLQQNERVLQRNLDQLVLSMQRGTKEQRYLQVAQVVDTQRGRFLLHALDKVQEGSKHSQRHVNMLHPITMVGREVHSLCLLIHSSIRPFRTL